MNILHIDSSALGDNSISRQLTAEITRQLKEARPDAKVTYRDVAAAAPAHLSGEILAANFIDASAWNETQREQKALSDVILNEFLAADTVVVGAPMYNFSVPSQLKSWIDRIVLAGKTFKYTETGPQGLVTGKTVIIASTRGGKHGDSPSDHQESYLRTVFGFIGVTDVRFVRAEGVNMGPEVKDAAMAAARGQIAGLAA